MQPAMMTINTSAPPPTLAPIMILLLTPPVSPLMMLLLVNDGIGMYDTGLPLVALISWILVPKAIVLTTESCVVAGNAAAEPKGTAVTMVLVTVFFVVDCSEAGQFTNPVDRHTVAVYVTLVLVVVVTRSSLAIIWVAEAAALAAAVALPVIAHASRSVVYQIGICVLAVGPHVWSSIASVAPAFAPSSSEYSSVTPSSQMLLLPEGAAVTLVMNCATSAQTAASMPVLKLRENPSMVLVGVLNSKPAFAPMRRRAVSTTPALWIVTGRNSKLAPLLRK